MKNGENILVRDGSQWKSGIFIAKNLDGSLRVGIGNPNHFDYRITDRDGCDVKRYIRLSTEEAADTHAKEAPELFALIKEASERLLPNVKVELIEGCISALNGGVTCEPVIFEQARIGAVQEMAGWQVNIWRHIMATQYEPETVDDSPQGKPSRNLKAVAQIFLEAVYRVISAEYWENKMMEEFERDFVQ